MRIFLLHWHAAEADALAAELRDAGFTVDVEGTDGARAAKEIVSDPPDALVISLRRKPSHGRQTAHYLRTQTPARDVPMVFFDGEPEQVEYVRSAVPDATYTSWEQVPRLVQALKSG